MAREYACECVCGGGGGGGGGRTGQKDLLLERCLKCQSSGGERERVETRRAAATAGGGGGGGGQRARGARLSIIKPTKFSGVRQMPIFTASFQS